MNSKYSGLGVLIITISFKNNNNNSLKVETIIPVPINRNHITSFNFQRHIVGHAIPFNTEDQVIRISTFEDYKNREQNQWEMREMKIVTWNNSVKVEFASLLIKFSSISPVLRGEGGNIEENIIDGSKALEISLPNK